MTLAASLGPFVGRAAEMGALRAELNTVRSGTPRVLVVQGDAGIGKTQLLEQFLAGETDLTVLRATGEPWEAFVAFGVVDQIMRVAGVSTARLLISRDRSFPPEEPVGVGAWMLDVLKEMEQKAPVAVVVDDAHWADMDSLRALLFAARRLVDERVLVVFGQRTEDEQRLPEGLRRLAGGRTGATLDLQPLPASEVQQLAAALGVRGFSSRAAQRLHAHTGGNALYLTTMLAELPEKQWRTWSPSLPAPRAFATQVLRRLDATSRPTRGLVEAVAVLGNTAPVAAAATLAGVSDLFGALDEASAVGLLQVREEFGIREVGFPHPLVQAAVYEQLGPLRRMQLHSAAAEFVEDEGALLRHRVLAATPPDPELATELEAFARREAAVGGWASAAWALVEGSNLSPDQGSARAAPAPRGRRDDRRRGPDAGRGVRPRCGLVQPGRLAGGRAGVPGHPARSARRGRGAAGPRLAAVRTRSGHLGGRGGGPATGPARGRAASRRRGGQLVAPGGRARPARRPGTGGGRGAARAGHGLAGAHRRGHQRLRRAARPGERRRGRPAAGAHPDGARLATPGPRRRGRRADLARDDRTGGVAGRIGAHRGLVVLLAGLRRVRAGGLGRGGGRRRARGLVARRVRHGVVAAAGALRGGAGTRRAGRVERGRGAPARGDGADRRLRADGGRGRHGPGRGGDGPRRARGCAARPGTAAGHRAPSRCRRAGVLAVAGSLRRGSDQRRPSGRGRGAC